MPTRIQKYEEAFDLIGVALTDKVKERLKRLEAQGHTEKSICFAIWKGQEKLYAFRHDNRFWGIFTNEVNKWSWKKDDPRWVEYNKRKIEIEKAEALKKESEKKEKEIRKIKEKYPGYIYFVQGASGGAVKIGYAKDVAARLKGLQTGFPDTLMLLCAVPGKPKNEKELHEKYKEHALRGEWFKPSEEIMEFINKYKIKILPIDQTNSRRSYEIQNNALPETLFPPHRLHRTARVL